MEALSRQEYPAMLAYLPPAQAVSTLSERIKRIGRVNIEIADWLQERRRVEEAYVTGLRKLAHKQPPDSQSELGIFTAQWHKIIAATESIAQSHQTFAASIERDVELPLRNFAAKNRELLAMSTIQGNLVAMQKELDEAQLKAEKLGKKGAKANSLKVDTASHKLETAHSQWDSQAPFVFEKLQAVDESRLNHLRDVLTQYQTHEADQVERSRVTAEATLNSLLELDTTQEIQNFAKNAMQGKPKLEKITRRTSSSTGSNTLPPPPVPKVSTEDGASEHSGRNEGSSESKGGLKRFRTMIGQRRQSVHGSFVRAPSPPKSFGPFGRAPGSREGRPTPSPRASSNNLRDTPSRDNRLSSLVESPISPSNVTATSQSERGRSQGVTNGEFTGFRAGSLLNPEVIPPRRSTSDNVNGTASKDIDLSDVKPPPGPPPSRQKDKGVPTTERDPEGFTIPATSNDPISQLQQEAASEIDQPQFKLDIKNEPIREEDADAQAARSNVANTLRSTTIPTPSRKAGTIRGRRDVRNTIFVPPPDISENNQPPSPGQSQGNGKPATMTTLSTEHSISDTQSIRSASSLTGSLLVKHPDMHQPGLNSSIVETVSASFGNGEIMTGTVIGEVALAYCHAESTPASSLSSLGTQTIRLNNFAALEAINPNHAFVSELSNDKPGEYNVNLSLLSRTMVAFRYKVHVDETNQATYAPLIIKPAWKPQGERLGVVIEYRLNPAFASTSVVLHNLVLIATYEGARAAGCQTKPTGTHIKDRSLIYWRLGNVTLDGNMQKVVGRLVGAEGGEPKPGVIEARWELLSSPGHASGSGLGVSRLETSGKGKEKLDSSNPFADESVTSPVTASPSGSWVELESQRKIISGKYDAK